jgi:hypothetical protein
MRTGIGFVLAVAATIAIVHRLPLRSFSPEAPSKILREIPVPGTTRAPIGTPVPAPAGTRAAFGPSVAFRTHQLLVEHYNKHGAEFAGASIEEYLRMAQALRDAPVGGAVIEMTRDDGVITRFDRTAGAFLAFNPDGTIRTFFRPRDGERYFRRQATRGGN